MSRKLYVISFPLGNKNDITLRAIEILEGINYVAAEDTRQVGKLFALHSLKNKPKFISYRDQNHDKVLPKILNLLANNDVALVSDRGTPTISDPGFKLVRDVAAAGFEVITIPGPSAAIAALSISGLPTDKFTFLGFLPRSAGKQKKILKEFGSLPATFIIYESPFRVVKLVKTIQEVLGEVNLALAHELTKVNEEVLRGTPGEILQLLEGEKLKGEWVVMGRV